MIEAEFKLSQVLLHMLPGNTLMSPAHAVLEVRPEAFERVRVYIAAHPFTEVIDGSVLIPELAKSPVSLPCIGANNRAGFDVLDDVREQRFSLSIRHDARNDLAATLHHPEDRSLVRLLRVGVAGSAAFATDVRLIDLDVTAEIAITVYLTDVLADLIGHSPSSLVGHA